MDNIYVSSYCSVAPGGDFNTITGTITFDGDNNGCSAADILADLVKVTINDGTNTGAVYSDEDGNYQFYAESGNFTITPATTNNWFTVSPASAAVNFATVNNSTSTHDFCVIANGVHPDAEILFMPVTAAQPGFDAVYKILYNNKGNQTLSGTATLNYDDALIDVVMASPVQASSSTGQLTWDYNNLLPFESRSIYVTFNVNSPQGKHLL
jgi:hypothetical protein